MFPPLPPSLADEQAEELSLMSVDHFMKISEQIDNISSLININDVACGVITMDNIAEYAVKAYVESLPNVFVDLYLYLY